MLLGDSVVFYVYGFSIVVVYFEGVWNLNRCEWFVLSIIGFVCVIVDVCVLGMFFWEFYKRVWVFWIYNYDLVGFFFYLWEDDGFWVEGNDVVICLIILIMFCFLFWKKL